MNEQPIFETWNQFRSQRNSKGAWKGCGKLTGYTKSTIRAAVKAHGGPEWILTAIANYYMIWYGKDYKWTYAWTLCQFLTRKDRHSIPQICQFLPGNFRAETYLRDSVKKHKADMERAEAAKNKYELQMKSMPKEPRQDGRRAKELLKR